MSLRARKILRAFLSILFIALSVLMYIFVLSRGELL